MAVYPLETPERSPGWAMLRMESLLAHQAVDWPARGGLRVGRRREWSQTAPLSPIKGSGAPLTVSRNAREEHRAVVRHKPADAGAAKEG